MKIKNIILSIILLAITAVGYGQRSFTLERLITNQYPEEEYMSANYATSNHVDIWNHNKEGWANRKVSWDVFESPVVSRTIFVRQADVLHEGHIRTESWMTRPFKSSIAEQDIILESWMTTPFDTDVVEEDVQMESWMTAPFASKHLIRVEEWML